MNRFILKNYWLMHRIFYFIFILLVASCNSIYTPKKEGYYKINFPSKDYAVFNDSSYPYTFEYPVYAKISKDSSYFNDGAKNPYWINIDFPSFNGTIFISYKNIGGTSTYKIKNPDGSYRDSIGKNIFGNLVNDSYKLTYKNDVKAYSINDSVMHTPYNVTGVFFTLAGNVATAKQFFLTDTLHHFLRGALYFDATPNEDSLRPVNAFLQQDMKHLINTLKWK
jgi:gliding motility-associated lipoprotein GldD